MATKVVYRHFHDGNDQSRSVRGSSLYATRCRLIDSGTKAVLSEGWAFCNPCDRPSRELGRHYSLQRVVEQCGAISKASQDIDNFLFDQVVTAEALVTEPTQILDSRPSMSEVPDTDIRYLV